MARKQSLEISNLIKNNINKNAIRTIGVTKILSFPSIYIYIYLFFITAFIQIKKADVYRKKKKKNKVYI